MITSTPVTTGREGSAYRYDVDAEDTDPIFYSLDGRDVPDGMAIDSESGLVTWDVPEGAAGDYRIIVRAADYGSEDSQTYTLVVVPNTPPQITNKAFTPRLVPAGLDYAHTLDVEDPDPEDVITYSLTENPSGMSIDSAGAIAWTSPTANVGTVFPAAAEVSDGRAIDAHAFDVRTVHTLFFFTQPQPIDNTYSVFNRIDSVGTGNLILGTVDLVGPDAGEEMVIVDDQCSGRVLPPGTSCFIFIDITPVAVGTKAATVVIPTNVFSIPVLYLGWTLDAVDGAGLTSEGVAAVEHSPGVAAAGACPGEGGTGSCLASTGGPRN